MFVILDDFENRRSPDRSVDAIAQNLRTAYQKEIPEAVVTVLPAAPVRGVGRTGGFTFVVEHRDGADLKALQDLQTAIDDLIVKGNQLTSPSGKPLFAAPLNTVFRANAPQLFVDLNRAAVHDAGRPLSGGRQHAAGLSRLAVRQQFQPPRPHVAGDRAGGRPASATTSNRSSGLRCGIRPARWCPSARLPTSAASTDR